MLPIDPIEVDKPKKKKTKKLKLKTSHWFRNSDLVKDRIRSFASYNNWFRNSYSVKSRILVMPLIFVQKKEVMPLILLLYLSTFQRQTNMNHWTYYLIND